MYYFGGTDDVWLGLWGIIRVYDKYQNCLKPLCKGKVNIKEPYQAGDYLYYFGGTDDVWLGLWGIIRVYDKYQNCLKPLCKGKDMILPLPPCPGKRV